MTYVKPEVLAQSKEQMAVCKGKPAGRPCNPPGPGKGK
jgi:hypothetical protein